MVNSITLEEEKNLADHLRREAETTRPEFSETLHGRILRTLEDRKSPARQHGQASWPRRRWAYAAVAATLLIGASLLAWRLSTTTGPGPGPAEEIATGDDPAGPPAVLPAMVDVAGMADGTTQQVGTLASVLTTEQWAYLDHDARVAMDLLIDQLPFGLTKESEL